MGTLTRAAAAVALALGLLAAAGSAGAVDMPAPTAAQVAAFQGDETPSCSLHPNAGQIGGDWTFTHDAAKAPNGPIWLEVYASGPPAVGPQFVGWLAPGETTPLLHLTYDAWIVWAGEAKYHLGAYASVGWCTTPDDTTVDTTPPETIPSTIPSTIPEPTSTTADVCQMVGHWCGDASSAQGAQLAYTGANGRTIATAIGAAVLTLLGLLAVWKSARMRRA